MIRPRRSVLYIPASNARALAKAAELACDTVILDLEDAVAPEAKETARLQAVSAMAAGFGDREVVLRVNALDSPWGEADLAAAAQALPDAVLAPKVDDVASLHAYDGGLRAAADKLRLWAMIETPRGVLSLAAVAGEAVVTRLEVLVLGLNDLAAATRARQTLGREPFVYAMSAAVTAARAHGLAVLDGVHGDLDDDAGFEAACRQGRDFGFDGKTLIHPRQIDAANRIFGPSAEETAWARAVVDAFAHPANAGKGVLRLQGRMVERLHLAEAERVLAFSD